MRRRRKYKGYSNKHPFYLFPVLSTTSPPEDSSVLYDSFGLQKFNFVLYTELTCSWQHFWPSVPGRKLVGEYLLSSGFLGFSHLLQETKLGHSSLGRTMTVEIPLTYLPVDMAIKLELWLIRFRKEAKEWRWERVCNQIKSNSIGEENQFLYRSQYPYSHMTDMTSHHVSLARNIHLRFRVSSVHTRVN